jgi:hypothetical protein
MYSFGNQPPNPDSQLGGTEDYTMLGYNLKDQERGRVEILFKRKLVTGDSLYDANIVPR